jgi:hypothetical protein
LVLARISKGRSILQKSGILYEKLDRCGPVSASRLTKISREIGYVTESTYTANACVRGRDSNSVARSIMVISEPPP